MLDIKQITEEIHCLFLCCRDRARPETPPPSIVQAYVLLSTKCVLELIEAADVLLSHNSNWGPPILLRVLCEKAIEMSWVASGENPQERVSRLDLKDCQSAKTLLETMIRLNNEAGYPVQALEADLAEVNSRVSLLEKKFSKIEKAPKWEVMAGESGPEVMRLYGSVYRQLSATVHAGAFELSPLEHKFDQETKDFEATEKRYGQIDHQIMTNQCLLEYSKAIDSLFGCYHKRQLENCQKKLEVFVKAL